MKNAVKFEAILSQRLQDSETAAEYLTACVEEGPEAFLLGLHDVVKASDNARQRVWTLIAKEKGSGLLPEENVELDDYLKLEHLVVLAKTKALAIQRGGKELHADFYRMAKQG